MQPTTFAVLHRTKVWLTSLFALLAIGFTITGVTLQIWAMPRGLDISDEAFYYLVVENAQSMAFALRFQQYLLWPLSQLFGSSIVGLRSAGFLTGILIFGWLGLISLRRAMPSAPLSVSLAVVVALAASTGLDQIFFLRLPSYITAASWGAALYLTGTIILIADLKGRGDSLASVRHVLISAICFIVIGAVIAGLGRPPTGLILVLGACFLPGLFVYYRALAHLPFAIFVAFGVAFFCASVLALLGLTPTRFWSLWQTAMELRSEFSIAKPWLQGHLKDIVVLSELRPNVVMIFYLACAALALCLAATYCPEGRFRTALMLLLIGLSGVLCAYCFWQLSPIGLARFYHLATIAADVGVAAISWITFVTAINIWFYKRLPPMFLPALIALLLPIAIVFGTGSTIYAQLASSIALFGAATIIIAVSQNTSLLATTAAAAVAGLALQFQLIGMDAPYRVHGTIWENDTPVIMQGNSDSRLYMHPETAAAYQVLQTAAANLPPLTPLLDITGRRPGLTLVLPTTAPVYPWIASGYPNSPELLAFVWEAMTPEKRASAWLLGPLHESFESSRAPSRLLRLEECYEQVVTTTEPRTGQALELWRPKVERTALCAALKVQKG